MNVEQRVTPDGLHFEVRSERDIDTAVHELFVSLARVSSGVKIPRIGGVVSKSTINQPYIDRTST
jgi:hypothetical protein